MYRYLSFYDEKVDSFIVLKQFCSVVYLLGIYFMLGLS